MRCQKVSGGQQSSGKIERHENGFVEKSVAEEDDALRWSKLGQGRKSQAKHLQQTIRGWESLTSAGEPWEGHCFWFTDQQRQHQRIIWKFKAVLLVLP